MNTSYLYPIASAKSLPFLDTATGFYLLVGPEEVSILLYLILVVF